MINLEWFRTFKSVYEKGSMTAAADALYMSQPGVSLHLSSLENHIGYQLFERKPRKLIPTERAKFLYNTIIDPLQRLEEAEQRFQKHNDESIPTITLGMCFETFQESLEEHIPELPMNLILEFDSYRNLLDKLSKGLVDLVVTPHKTEIRDIRYRPFSQEHIVLIAGRGTSLHGFQQIIGHKSQEAVMEWMKSQKWYGITGDNEHLIRFWEQNFSSHPDFRPNYIVPNIHSIVRCLADSPGLAVIPDFLCREQVKEGNITILWEGYAPLSNVLYFARNKRGYHHEELDMIEGIISGNMP